MGVSLSQMPNTFTIGSRPEGSSPGDAISVRIPYNAAPEEHADIRRKLAAGWQLGEITGELSSDDLLGEIFGSFCIGK